MPGILDLVLGAGGGGIFGSLLQMGSSWLDTANKIKLAKAHADIAKIESENKVKEQEAVAFANAQNNTSAPFLVPTNAAPWASSMFTVVQALKEATRPLLTWALLLITLFIFIESTPEVRQTMTPDVVFGTFTAVMFWFGSRFTKK